MKKPEAMGILPGESAEVADVAVVGLLVDEADGGEEQRGHDAVGEHLEDRAGRAVGAEGVEAEEHDAHV